MDQQTEEMYFDGERGFVPISEYRREQVAEHQAEPDRDIQVCPTCQKAFIDCRCEY